MRRQGPEDFYQFCFFDLLGRGVIDFKHPNIGLQGIQSVGSGVKPGAQTHELLQQFYGNIGVTLEPVGVSPAGSIMKIFDGDFQLPPGASFPQGITAPISTAVFIPRARPTCRDTAIRRWMPCWRPRRALLIVKVENEQLTGHREASGYKGAFTLQRVSSEQARSQE